MRVCKICEGLLSDNKFSSIDSEICTVCQEKLSRVTNITYSLPEHKTVLTAYLSLINAIRMQAIVDDELEDFEDFWLYTSPFPVIWDLMGDLDRKENYTEVLDE